MPEGSTEQVSELLQAWGAGDKLAFERLVPMVYSELRQLARRRISFGQAGDSLQPTALVNELYLRLAGKGEFTFTNRSQFFGLAAQLMRRILVDAARARRRSKRGGDVEKCSFEEAYFAAPGRDREMIALDDALEALAKLDARKTRAVELRFFGGLSIEETAEVMGISVQTVRRDWNLARSWLAREMNPMATGESPEA
jgi:RNA polymerase sigma-70 factor (ECF subfamily)